MANYLIRRMLLMIPTLFGMTAVVFFVMQASPGNVVEMLIDAEGAMQPGDRQAREEYIRERYGLDRPAHEQYISWINKVSPLGVWTEGESLSTGFGFKLGESEKGNPIRLGLKTPDLGQSFIKNRPVLDLLAEAMPITILLNLLSIPLFYAISVVAGVYAARHRGEAFDVVSGMIMLGLWSVPTIWAGVLLQGFLCNRVYLDLFPTVGLHDLQAHQMAFLPRYSDEGFQRGYLLDALWHLVLPVICLSYGSFAFMSKLARGAVLENLMSDFARTAKAKGVAEQDVLWRHVFRNSLLPMITVAAFVLPSMIGGSIIVEVIFGIPGMGKLMVESIEFKDQEVVMAVTLASGVLTLGAYLIADVLYAVADPRVSYE